MNISERDLYVYSSRGRNLQISARLTSNTGQFGGASAPAPPALCHASPGAGTPPNGRGGGAASADVAEESELFLPCMREPRKPTPHERLQLVLHIGPPNWFYILATRNLACGNIEEIMVIQLHSDTILTETVINLANCIACSSTVLDDRDR